MRIYAGGLGAWISVHKKDQRGRTYRLITPKNTAIYAQSRESDAENLFVRGVHALSHKIVPAFPRQSCAVASCCRRHQSLSHRRARGRGWRQPFGDQDRPFGGVLSVPSSCGFEERRWSTEMHMTRGSRMRTFRIALKEEDGDVTDRGLQFKTSGRVEINACVGQLQVEPARSPSSCKRDAVTCGLDRGSRVATKRSRSAIFHCLLLSAQWLYIISLVMIIDAA